MKKLRSALTILLITLVSLSMSLYFNVQKGITQSSTTLSVSPSVCKAMVNETFIVNVTVSEVIDLYGWEFKLGWYEELLEVINVTEGDFLKKRGETFFIAKINNTAGYLIADCTLLGNVPGVSGGGTLATIEFIVKSTGESVLNLYRTKLVSSFEESIAHTTEDGYFITIVRDIAILNVVISKTDVVIGEVVQINITVKNEGTETETFNVTLYYNDTALQTKLITNLTSGMQVNMTFSWDTEGLDPGNYTIKVVAEAVPDEVDVADNVYATLIRLYRSIHDIAITSVTLSKSIVAANQFLYINVTIENRGSFNETFDIYVCLDQNLTVAGDEIIIINQRIDLMPPLSHSILELSWNVTGIALGEYRLIVETSDIINDINVENNVYIYGIVIITIFGDLNGDWRVNIVDVSIAARAFGSYPGHPRWNPNADINNDQVINIVDIAKVAREYGKSAD